MQTQRTTANLTATRRPAVRDPDPQMTAQVITTELLNNQTGSKLRISP